MNPTQRAFYDYITAEAMLPYYAKTDYASCYADWEQLDELFRSQLTPEQAALMEQLDKALFYRQNAELEAMFLATGDQLSALLLPSYFPRMAAK